MTKKTTLTIDIKYDPEVTDPEGLASACDRLLETVLSTPGIMEEYGDPKFSEFYVVAGKANGDSTSPGTEHKRWVLYDADAGTLLTTTVYDTYEEAVEDASDPRLHDVMVLPLTWEEVST